MGAAYNNLMEEETKESLAQMCCDLMRQRNKKQYEFLDSDFLTSMNEIGRLGHEKFKTDAIEVAGATRKIKRHQKDEILFHAREHLADYEYGIPHDKLGTLSGHLAATAFNSMLEFIFSRDE